MITRNVISKCLAPYKRLQCGTMILPFTVFWKKNINYPLRKSNVIMKKDESKIPEVHQSPHPSQTLEL